MNASLPQQWFDRAREDLQVARLVLQERHYAHGCFLSQQCIEKALKAYFLAKANTYPRAHKLVDLLAECEALDSAFEIYRADCIVVDQYSFPPAIPMACRVGCLADCPVKPRLVKRSMRLTKFSGSLPHNCRKVRTLDPDAPILKQADAAMVGDPAKVAKELAEALSKNCE